MAKNTFSSVLVLVAATLASGCEETKSSVSNPSDTLVTVSWAPNAEPVLGYEIFVGKSSGSADRFAADVSYLDPGFDAFSPSVVLHAGRDLRLSKGDPVCIRVRAYDEVSSSNYSIPVCGRLPG